MCNELFARASSVVHTREKPSKLQCNEKHMVLILPYREILFILITIHLLQLISLSSIQLDFYYLYLLPIYYE
jgi:hypothetical protein